MRALLFQSTNPTFDFFYQAARGTGVNPGRLGNPTLTTRYCFLFCIIRMRALVGGRARASLPAPFPGCIPHQQPCFLTVAPITLSFVTIYTNVSPIQDPCSLRAQILIWTSPTTRTSNILLSTAWKSFTHPTITRDDPNQKVFSLHCPMEAQLSKFRLIETTCSVT